MSISGDLDEVFIGVPEAGEERKRGISRGISSIQGHLDGSFEESGLFSENNINVTFVEKAHLGPSESQGIAWNMT